MLYVAHIMIHAMWRFKIDPDNSAIPYLTALGDLSGTLLLAGALWFLKEINREYGNWRKISLDINCNRNSIFAIVIKIAPHQKVSINRFAPSKEDHTTKISESKKRKICIHESSQNAYRMEWKSENTSVEKR